MTKEIHLLGPQGYIQSISERNNECKHNFVDTETPKRALFKLQWIKLSQHKTYNSV